MPDTYLLVGVVKVSDHVEPHHVNPVRHNVHLRHKQESELEAPSCRCGGAKRHGNQRYKQDRRVLNRM